MLDVDDNAHIKPIFHKDMENSSNIQHCPKKGKSIYYSMNTLETYIQ